jgi:hypothetical protein
MRPVNDPVFIAMAKCSACLTTCTNPMYSLTDPSSTAASYFNLSPDGLLTLSKQLNVEEMTAAGVLDANSSLSIRINSTLTSGASALMTLTVRIVKQDVTPGEGTCLLTFYCFESKIREIIHEQTSEIQS